MRSACSTSARGTRRCSRPASNWRPSSPSGARSGASTCPSSARRCGRPTGARRCRRPTRRFSTDPGAGAFVDCLHFDAPFLVKLGRIAGDERLVDAGADQALATIALLQQPDGFFAHFFLERTGQTYGHGWGRGQGWALLGLLDVIDQLPEGHRHAGEIRASFVRLADALVGTQEPDGHWPTPIPDRASFHETSTASFAAAGLARGVALGLLGEPARAAARAAWDASLASVGSDGTTTGVSAALWASTASSHYAGAPVGFQVPWGAGPFLVAAREHLAPHPG